MTHRKDTAPQRRQVRDKGRSRLQSSPTCPLRAGRTPLPNFGKFVTRGDRDFNLHAPLTRLPGRRHRKNSLTALRVFVNAAGMNSGRQVCSARLCADLSKHPQLAYYRIGDPVQIFRERKRKPAKCDSPLSLGEEGERETERGRVGLWPEGSSKPANQSASQPMANFLCCKPFSQHGRRRCTALSCTYSLLHRSFRV